MFTTGIVAIGLLLSSRGEAPREEKFQGVLLAQAEVAQPAVNADAQRRELEGLIRARPTFAPAWVTLGVGGGVAVLGVVLFFVGLLNVSSFAGALALIAGIFLVPGGLITIAVAIAVFIGIGIEQAVYDDKIRALEARPLAPEQPQAPPPVAPSVPSVMLENTSRLVLARF